MIARALAIVCAVGAMGGAVAVAALGVRADGPATTNATTDEATPFTAAAPGSAFLETAKKKKKVKKKAKCGKTTRVKVKVKVKAKIKAKAKVGVRASNAKKKKKKKRKKKTVACRAPTTFAAPDSPPSAAAPTPPHPGSPSPPPGGEVEIEDDDSGVVLHSVSGARPGQVEDRCIRVTYRGRLSADTRLYLTGSAGALGPHVAVSITPGTGASGAFPSCAGFTTSEPDLFSGTLTQLATHAGWASGLVLVAPGNDRWQAGDSVTFRVRVGLADTNAANGGALGPLTAGPYSLVWEARDG